MIFRVCFCQFRFLRALILFRLSLRFTDQFCHLNEHRKFIFLVLKIGTGRFNALSRISNRCANYNATKFGTTCCRKPIISPISLNIFMIHHYSWTPNCRDHRMILRMTCHEAWMNCGSHQSVVKLGVHCTVKFGTTNPKSRHSENFWQLYSNKNHLVFHVLENPLLNYTRLPNFALSATL